MDAGAGRALVRQLSAMLSFWFCLAMATAPAVVASAPEKVTTWSLVTHPLSYQGRTLTRDSLGNYFAVIRGGNQINIWKRSVGSGAWSNVAIITDTNLSGREGDCASIAVDGLNRIHVVFYDGAGPNLMHKMSNDGAMFGAAHLIQSSVTWTSQAAGGPSLHIDADNGLHVAFIDDASAPYYAYSANSGSSWTVTQVSTLGYVSLRPSVTSIPGGRVIYGFSAPGFHSFYSDNHGGSWTEASPANSTGWTVVNCRLAGNGNDVYVTGQMISPTPRAIIMNKCAGASMSWGAWDPIQSGTGADASLFLTSDGRPHVVWRQYPDTTYTVKHSYLSGTWQTANLTTPGDNYIFPYAYWQEFHRWQPGANLGAALLPNSSTNTIYFQFLDGAAYLPETAAPPPAAPGSLIASGGNAQATLTWPAVSSATSYTLYYRIGSDVNAANGTPIPGATSPFTKTSLANGTQYAFAVSAVNAGGESPVSPIATVTPKSALSITTASLPDARVNSSYAASLQASGGSSPYVWTIASASLPAGLSISGSGLTGTPLAAESKSFTLRATDASGAFADRPLSMAILPNRKPRVTSPISAAASAGLPFRYRATGSDSDGNVVSLTFSAVPAWLIPGGDSLAGTPPFGTATAAFKVVAGDGNMYDTVTVSIAISQSNRAPVLDSVRSSKSSPAEGDTVLLRAWAFDPDGDALSAIWTLDGVEAARGPLQFTYVPNHKSAGSRSFGLRIEDGRGGSAEVSVPVTVRNTPLPPECLNPGPGLGQADQIQWGWPGERDPDLDSAQLRYAVAVYGDSALTQLIFSKDSSSANKAIADQTGIRGQPGTPFWIKVSAFDSSSHNTGWGKVRKYVLAAATSNLRPGGLAGRIWVRMESQGHSLPARLLVHMPSDIGRLPGGTAGAAAAQVRICIYDARGGILLRRGDAVPKGTLPETTLSLDIPAAPVRSGPWFCKVGLEGWERVFLIPIE